MANTIFRIFKVPDEELIKAFEEMAHNHRHPLIKNKKSINYHRYWCSVRPDYRCFSL